jgi:hypothetical protein
MSSSVLFCVQLLSSNSSKNYIFCDINIRMDLGEVWGDVDCIGLAKDRNRWRALVDSVLNLRVP